MFYDCSNYEPLFEENDLFGNFDSNEMVSFDNPSKIPFSSTVLDLNENNPTKDCINLNENNTNVNEIDILMPKCDDKEKNIKGDEENVSKIENSKTTKENSLSNNFLIIKDYSRKNKKNANLGRKRKDIDYNREKIHNRDCEDNIRLKFKRLFFKNLILFINHLLANTPNMKLNGKEIKKIESVYINSSKKDKNLKMLDLTAKEILSKEICKKFKKFSKDHNINLIKSIYEENETNIIKVLNKSIRKLMEIFCRDKVKNNIFKHYKRLNYYMNEFLNKKKENEKYIEKFIYQAKNYEEIYNNIDGRNEENKNITKENIE